MNILQNLIVIAGCAFAFTVLVRIIRFHVIESMEAPVRKKKRR